MMARLIAVHGVTRKDDFYECDVTLEIDGVAERCVYIARAGDKAPVNLALLAWIAEHGSD